MSRRKIESPEDYRPIDGNSGQQTSERKSVFERLGTVGRRIGATNRNSEYNETDLRYRVSRNRKTTDISPNRRSISPQIRHQSSVKTSAKSDDKVDTNSKVKSLVLAPNGRSESPANHSQSVSSSSTSKRSTHSSHKWDDDIDSEVLEQKRLQLQKELQELEKSGSIVNNTLVKTEATNPLPIETTVTQKRSRSSSVISSESDSYSSSLKSLAKTESSESSSNNADKKVVNSLAVKEDSNNSINKSKSSDKTKTPHVSSSISLKSVTHSEDTTRVKTSELKFDRHGNVRISLDEQERQKRLRAERFGQNKAKTESSSKRKLVHDSNNSIEPTIVVSREHSYSPPSKRSKESATERYRDINERNDEHKRDDYKNKSNSSRSKYESSTRSRSRERRDSRNSKHDDSHSKCSDRSSRTYLNTKSPNFRDRSRDSRYSDRDNTSVTSKHSRKIGDNYSRDQSPTHSSHSKLSRDRESSIGSDFSRRSKSERLSTQSIDMTAQTLNNSELKNSEIKTSDNIIEEMSPISADSTIPDVTEIDSPNTESSKAGKQKEESLSPNKKSAKTEDESEDNFSDWSEGEDELLLKTDGFETLDEVCNISDNSIGKDSWNEKSNQSPKADSSNTQTHSRDDALEAISDDELDAIIGDSDPIDSTVDSKTIVNSNRHVLDALDIDWGSLVSEPKTKLEFIPGSARKRFSAANVLMRIGFSHAFAGQHMTKKLIDYCQSELKDEFVPFRHPIAAVHSLISERIKERRYLFGADTTQVLSGRKDLQIRKMLNKCNYKVFDNNITPNGTTPISQPITTSTVNDFSVSSTNILENNVSDIECF